MTDCRCVVLNYSSPTKNLIPTELVVIKSLMSLWFSPSSSKVGPYTVNLSTCRIVHPQLKLRIVYVQRINRIYLRLFFVLVERKYKYFDVRTPQLRVIEAILGIYDFLFLQSVTSKKNKWIFCCKRNNNCKWYLTWMIWKWRQPPFYRTLNVNIVRFTFVSFIYVDLYSRRLRGGFRDIVARYIGNEDILVVE